jgi:hypothetical protein
MPKGHRNWDATTRRGFLKSGAAGTALTGLGATLTATRISANPVAEENEKPGDEGWVPTGVSDRSIEGYASETSVTPGGTVDLHVSTKPAHRYRVDIYRIGWYGGAGGRLLAQLPPTQGEPHPQPDPDPVTGRVECDWPVTDTYTVPQDTVSGCYIAIFALTSGPNSGDSAGYPFVVQPRRDRWRSKILVQLPVATEQAYNSWGGKSLYGFNSTNGEKADKVSYDRPYNNPPTNHLDYAIHFLRFLEAEGYDASYVGDVDVHRAPSRLQNHRVVIASGHNEYWSKSQRDGFEAAQDSGVNLVFLGANICYWQVRYENDEQTMVCYKAEEDPVEGARETLRFRDLDQPRPEVNLIGVMFDGATYGTKYPDYNVVADSLDHPWMDGTGFKAGDTLKSLVGYEWDNTYPEMDGIPDAELTTFLHYEHGTQDIDISRPNDADSVGYTADSGGRVFSAGSLNLSWGLDPAPDAWPQTLYQGYSEEYDVSGDDDRLQAFMRNVLHDMTTGRPPRMSRSSQQAGAGGSEVGDRQQPAPTNEEVEHEQEVSYDRNRGQ